MEFEVPTRIDGPVYIYYRLTSFYQNNRMYVKSYNLHQLNGASTNLAELQKEGACNPLAGASNDNVPIIVNNQTLKPTANAVYYPCGLIANSLFSGTIISKANYIIRFYFRFISN